MKEVYFMRHGKAKRYAKLTNEDLGLTDDGKASALEVAHFLEKNFQGIEVIYSSPIRRAKETAELVGEVLGVPVVIDERLAEYSYGNCEGLSYEELSSKLGVDEEEGVFFAKEALDLHSYTTYERYGEVQERLCSAVSDIIERKSRALVVTHGEIIRTLMCEAEGRKEKLLEREKLEVKNAELFSFLFGMDSEKGCRVLSHKRIYNP